jgi:sulfate adenylyltransferase subunit 1
LVDARKGLTTQTKRHTSIGSLMGIKKAVVAINKIDLVDYSEDVFNTIKKHFESIKEGLHFDEIIYVPLSALNGDNIVSKSENTDWYNGQPLLEILENIQIPEFTNKESRFQVQWVIRPKDDEYHDYRGFAGTILSGSYAVGDTVKILPGHFETTITKIEKNQQSIDYAVAGDNVVLHFNDNIDICRGDTIVKIDDLPYSSNQINTWVSWLDHAPLQLGKIYNLQHRFKNVRVKVETIHRKWNFNDWEFSKAHDIGLNDIAQISIRTNQPLFFDAFEKNSKTGNAILIDETNFNTVGALMFLEN